MTDRVSPALPDALVPSPTLRDRVVAVLRAAIASGALPPATRLSEPALARQLRVSRGPIREAIRELAAEGLVRTEPRVGTFVTQMSTRDLDEACTVKKVLEGLAARLAAGAGTEETRRARLEPILEQLDAAAAARDGAGYSALVRQFHEAVFELAGNRRLATMYRTLADQVQHLRSAPPFVPRRIARACREYHALADAIVTGRQALAERLSRAEFARARPPGQVPVGTRASRGER